MTSSVPSKTDKSENIRRVGLYLGPLFLASTIGAAVYSTACGGRRFTLFSSTGPEQATLFLVAFLFIAWSVREPMTRMGFVLFAGVFGIALLGYTTGFVANRWLVNGIFVVGAALITLGGVRGATRRAIVVATSGFLLLFAFGYASRYYADVLLERHSVVRSSPLC